MYATGYTTETLTTPELIGRAGYVIISKIGAIHAMVKEAPSPFICMV